MAAFTRPLLLLLLPLLAYFIYLGRPVGRHRRVRGWIALALRCLIVTLIILSLAGLQSVHGGHELAVVFLVDVSDSVSPASQDRAFSFVEEAMAAKRPDDRIGLILFGADALVERPTSARPDLGPIASIPRTDQTDLEGAIRLGLALFPSGSARRFVILSDGRETLGEAEQVVKLARSQGVQVDVVPIETLGEATGGETEAWLEDLSGPSRLHVGETFTLSVTAHASREVRAELTVLSGDNVALQEVVQLHPGENTFAVSLTADEPGFSNFRAYLAPVDDVYPQNNALSAFSIVSGPPRIALVWHPGKDATAVETDVGYLETALESSGLDVTLFTTGGLPSEPRALAQFSSVVLVDTPARALSSRALEALHSYVRDLGGGLVAVGGPHAYGVGGWYDTQLEQMLPVEMEVQDQERFPPMAIVVVIDKSGSMSATELGVEKIRLAGEAAARVAELIHDQDEITVIAFDDRPVDVIGPLPGSQREDVIDQVIRLQAGGGGIYVRESLAEAETYLEQAEQDVRHVILLADGSDAEHQSGVAEMVDEWTERGITLSTVAIGDGMDVPFLRDIAERGQGRFHFTERASDLPVIFAEETQLAMRSYVVEEAFHPEQVGAGPMLVGIEAVPQLLGYVATTPKPAGRVVLSTHYEDPLLATWRYGLGRTVAWTSDATARWAQYWVDWEAFSTFWSQTVRWTISDRAEIPVEVEVGLDGREAHVTVDAVTEDGDFLNGLDVEASIVTPEGEALHLPLPQTAPGRYGGAFTPREEGAYVVRLTGAENGEDVLAMTTGWVKEYSPEYATLTADPQHLSYLAELGGGEVLTDPGEAVTHDITGRGVARPLWPYLLGMAVVLLPIDIAVRRLVINWEDVKRVWRWVLAHLPTSSEQAGIAEAPSPVGRLFQAKSRAEAGRKRLAHEEGAPPERKRVPAPRSQVDPRPRPAREAREESEGFSEHDASEDAGTLASRLLKRRRERED